VAISRFQQRFLLKKTTTQHKQSTHAHVSLTRNGSSRLQE